MTKVSLRTFAAVIVALGAACGGGSSTPRAPATTAVITAVATQGGSGTPVARASELAAPSVEATASAPPVKTSVAVTLADYSVTADKPRVSAGNVRFIATNTSATQVHEFVVLNIKPDGSFDNVGEVPDIAPESGGSIVVDLAPGAYQLACLITIGESGSTVDHYQQGMHTPFTVQ